MILNRPKDLAKFLENTEVMFDGEVHQLDEEDKQKLKNALEFVFWQAKEKNKLKKKWYYAVLNIPLRVKNLVNKFDTANPYKLAKRLNIDVYEYDLPIDIRGFIVRPLRRKCILLNKSLSETEKIVVLCHEIAHARLHSGYGYYMSTNRPYYKSCKREAEANEFALHLLSHCHDIDTTVIEPMIKQKMPDPHLVHRLLNEIIL